MCYNTIKVLCAVLTTAAEVFDMRLYGFNNLTKAMSFNIYDVCYAKTNTDQLEYIAYIDSQYSSDRLTKILYKLTDMIGAHVLNVSKQDYEPQGASVAFLIADTRISHQKDAEEEGSADGAPEIILGHLDKSHITVHTYPEFHPETSIATFRVDIDIETCGQISPLHTLDYLIGSFDSDIITMDYRVRGFTRDVNGRKLFLDHKMTSIQDYIDEATLDIYNATDINVYQANIFHTRLMIKELDLSNYLFNTNAYDLSPEERELILDNLQKEMIEIYSGKNVFTK